MGACTIMAHIVFLLRFWLLLSSSSAEDVVTIDVNEARSLLSSNGGVDNNYLCLDVRTEEEFGKGHLEKAVNIPVMFDSPRGMVKNPNFIDQVRSRYGKEDRLIVSCRSGVRSLPAATDLVNAGFKHVCNMRGGYLAWTQNGFPVVNSHNEELK
ncbi:thiosulfate sulfurtransferase 18-like [Andrographis paniculata]|uniref:thiosulfate sulfurtransferase 18-like n=1 Tax=Andrographis paniculata TaxID=175694 RepID=UPI0021E91813|nr:thiosulfate sulfurtransferase 18-like [Andrographis paniculata]